MKLTKSYLRKLIEQEANFTFYRPSQPRRRSLVSLIFEEDEKKDVDKSTNKFSIVGAETNIKDVDAEDIYNQLVSKDGKASIFGAMSNAKPRGYKVDPEKVASWCEKMGKDEFINRLSAIQGKIPSKGLPKDQMPVLPGPPDVKGGTIAQLKDILKPGGDYNVDFESKQVTGNTLAEARVYSRWGKLAGIISEKLDAPGSNELKGGDDASEKYLKSGLNDDNEKDDSIDFVAPGKVKAAAAIPTQTNILIGKTLGMAIPKDAGGGGIEGGDIGAYAGTDGEILDGHHRWAATMMANPSAELGTEMNIDLVAIGNGNKIKGLQHLTAIGNALGNPTKTQ